MANFDYMAAFSRNIGWVTPQEQEILRGKRVAIAGLGGVGGSHLLTLSRLGINRFHIADFDTFEIANFNRQAGATLHHLGRAKVDVLADMALDINSELEIRKFPHGIEESNLSEFLSGVDLYVDGLDFFAVAARRSVFAACTSLEIPAVTVAPLGTGAALLNFLPGGMSFEEYFRLEGCPEEEQLLRFLLGLSPAMLQLAYLVHPGAVDLSSHKGPSTAMACEISAGVAATEALKILLRRGKVVTAPRGLHFDPYRNRLAKTWRPGGNRNPIQKLSLRIAKRKLARVPAKSSDPIHYSQPMTTVERILDLARWAPSGDNSQPWRFEIAGESHIVVHGFDTREHCVYDLLGHASQLALGALIETATIAAAVHGLRTEVSSRTGTADTEPTFDMRLIADSSIEKNNLSPYIQVRSTQRRLMSTRALKCSIKQALEKAVSPIYTIHWFEDFADRMNIAKLLFSNAGIRLTMREAYEVHRRVIEWKARFSDERIPDMALGMDPVTTRIMRWALEDWKRVKFLNTYLGGTLAPRLQLDLLPGVACAAHFLIVAPAPARTVDDFVAAGRAVQRLWLTATQLGLWQQPEVTPLIFSSYLRDGINFTDDGLVEKRAQHMSARLEALISRETCERAVWMGRLGFGTPPTARSTRLALDRLIVT